MNTLKASRAFEPNLSNDFNDLYSDCSVCVQSVDLLHALDLATKVLQVWHRGKWSKSHQKSGGFVG